MNRDEEKTQWMERLIDCPSPKEWVAIKAKHKEEIQVMQLRLESLEQEMQEQARIIGMGAEREDRLMARVRGMERDCEELIKERDEREDVINELLNQVLSDERKDWSSAYDFADAVLDVECKMKLLEKDAARYRFAKSNKSQGKSDIVIVHKIWGGDKMYLSGDKADDAIDTAMQANKGE